MPEEENASVTRDELRECWCCSGLHDHFGSTLCPDCVDAGCGRFSDECESDHDPVLADGGEEVSAEDKQDEAREAGRRAARALRHVGADRDEIVSRNRHAMRSGDDDE